MMKKMTFVFFLGFISATAYLIACNGTNVSHASDQDELAEIADSLIGSWTGKFYVDASSSSDDSTFVFNADGTYSCSGIYQDDPNTFAGNLCGRPVSWELLTKVIRLVYTGPDESEAQALLPIHYSSTSKLQIVMGSTGVSTSLLDLNR